MNAAKEQQIIGKYLHTLMNVCLQEISNDLVM